MKSCRSVVVVALVAVFTLACVSGDQQRGTRHYNIISVEDEWMLGSQLAADIARRVAFVNDPQSLTYVRGIGERLVRQTKLANLPWEFHVISSPDVNAYASPGGHIYITTGAIQSMQNASELAALMGHILGHAVDRQSAAALSTQYGPRNLAQIARGKDTAAYNDILNQVLTGGAAMQYNAEDEKAANDPLPKWLQGAGYDPNGLVTLIQSLQASSSATVHRFLTAHPITADAITTIRSDIGKLPKKPGLLTDEPEFRAMKGRS